MDTYLFPQPMVLSGPIVQLIQAPNGTTQLVSTSTSPGSNSTAAGNNNSGGQPVVSASSTKNSSVNSSRSTKQILPKPPGNSGTNSQSGAGSGKSGSTVNNSGPGVNNSSANNNPNGNPGNQGARSLVTNMPSTVNTVGHTLTTGPLSTGPGPQILLGPPGNQKMSFINQPGTFLLNQVIPGLGSQPILIQGNINNIGGPLQLTLRQQQPHTPSMVAVSSANGSSVSVASSQGTTTTPLISALAGQTSTSVQRTTSTAPTYLFPNQGPNVSSAPTMVMASGQHNFRGQNIIFTRPPNLIGTPGSMVQGPGGHSGHPTQTVPQIIQIQTPNGPMLVALQTTPHLGPPSGGSQIIQTHVTPSPQAVPITSTIMPLQTSGTVANQSASTHPTLHTILQTSSAESLNQSSMGQQQSGAPLTANNLIFSQSGNVISSQQSVTTSTSLTHHQQQQQHHHQQKQSQTPHSSSTNNGRGNSKAKKESKGVNLADLLKETGILQDSSPPQSPSSITIRQTSTDTDMTNSISPQTEITQTSSLITGTTQTIMDSNHHHHHHHHQTNQSQQPTMLMVPGQGSHQGSNILIAQGPGIQPGTAPQLRLSLAPDGSVILQPTNMGPGSANTILQNPSNTSGTGTSIVSDLGSAAMASINNTKFIDTLRDSCGPGSSQPSPDSTTPTLDASTPTSTAVAAISSTKSNSPAITTLGSSPVMSHKQTLMQHLNAGSTMKVGDSVTSMTITPIMGPPLRDGDLKTGSSFIPLNITSDLSVRDSLTMNNLKTTFKQEKSADHLTSSSTATTTTTSTSPLLSEVKTEIVTVPLNNIPSTSSSTSATTTSVLTMSNCDNLGQNASMPVLLTNASLIIPEDANNSVGSGGGGGKQTSSTTTIANRSGILTPNLSANNHQTSNSTGSPLTSLVTPNGQSVVTPSSPAITGNVGGGVTSSGNQQQGLTPTIVDQNGYQFVQISLNNQEFIERLESQIKKLTALKSPKDDQKQLLQELLSLQKKMSGGKNQAQSSIAGESKIILTSQSPDLLLSSQPQQLQQQQSTLTPTGQQTQLTLQRKTISSPGPQSLPQSIQAHLQQLFPDTQQEPEQQQSQPAQHTSMPSILPKITSTQLLATTSQQLNQPHSPNPPTFNTLIKLNNSNTSSNSSNSNSTTSGINQLHQVTQSQIVTASPQAQNVRILTPGNTTSIDGNTTIQVGTQLITIAASPTAKSSTIQSSPLHKQSSGGSNSTTIQVVRIGTSNTSTSSTNSVNKYFKSPLESPQLESEKTKAKICRYFQQQAAADQSAAIKPDTKSPFKSRGDACKRLLRYHVFNTPVPSEEQLSKVDRDFEVISESLLKRKNELFNRFRYNLLKSNMIETPKAEYIMLNKWFINDENTSLQRDKDCVAQGKDLELPPPPESWKKIIRDSIEEEERLSINRKRKSSAIEDDFLADCTEIKKYDLESGDTDDDDEEDSDDEDDDEENTAAEDIAKYLGPNHHQDSVPDLGYYPDFNHTEMGLPTDVNSLTNPFDQRTNDNQDLLYNNDDWKSNNYMSTSSGGSRRFDGWGTRYDNENDVAVTTILGGGENGERTDHDTDLDLSSIQDFHSLDKYSCQPHTSQQPPPPTSTTQRPSGSTHPVAQASGYGLENSGPDDQRQSQHQSSSHHDDDEDDDDDEGVNEDEDDDEDEEDEDLTERTDDGNLQIPCQLSGILDMPLSHQSPQSSQSYFNSIHSTSSKSSSSQQQQSQSTSSHSSPDTSTNYGQQQQSSPQSTTGQQQQSKSSLDQTQQSTSTSSTAYPNQMHPMMHQPPQQQPSNHPTSPRSNMLGDFRNTNQMMSDPILDEAVRSILSWS